ncbi:MAG: DUF1015 domain-containing protein [Bacillota bacterium]|nr:DUF1015 domain-containing protein [Bacillota bacterium]
MAEIRPFKGIRFNPLKIQNMANVITPPYDVIDTREQNRLHELDPHNIIRLEYGLIKDGDNEQYNRYTRAADTLKRWLSDDVLRMDSSAGYYLYEQEFVFNNRKMKRPGIIAALKLEPYNRKTVLPHELTMKGPKEDRLALLNTIRSNISPIFTLFPDPEDFMSSLFKYAKPEGALFEARENSGQIHRLWQVQEPAVIKEITKYFQERQLLIADGHHRYETALHYSQTKARTGGDGGSSFVLSTMVSMQDEGLLALPTQRLLKGIEKEEEKELMARLQEHFTINESGNLAGLDLDKFREELKNIGTGKGGFGLFCSGKAFLIRPKFDLRRGDLAISLLHKYVLDINGESAGDSSEKETALSMSFEHDPAKCLEEVKNGNADWAFILDAVPVEKIFERSKMGLVMPRKSTYFYPKLPGGLVLYHMDLS